MSSVFTHGQLRLYLLKLLEESPRHGYDVIASLEDRFLGLYAPSAGTVYPRLARLESEGLIAHQSEGGRKVYRLTDAGRAELAARREELVGLEAEIVRSVKDLAGEVAREVRGSVRDLKAELKAAAREVRREGRSVARSAAWPGDDIGTGKSLVADLDLRLRALRKEVVQAAALARPSQAVAARCQAAIDDARDTLLAALEASPPAR